MDFHELRAFQALGRHLHFGKAAQAINASPSALSRMISRLEDEVGLPLVDRDTRRVVLTEDGKAFLDFCDETLRRRDELHLTMGQDSGELRGTLRLYASVTACYSILPPLARELGTRHPGLRLQVDTGDPADAMEALEAGGVDLALAAIPAGGFRNITCFSVQRTPLVFVASRDGPWGALSDPVYSRALADLPLIVPHKGLARERLDRWLKTRRIQAHVRAETAGNEAILALARLGLGLGLVPRLVLDNSPFAQGLVQYPGDPELGDYDIGFLFPVQRGSTRRLQEAMTEILGIAYPEGTWTRP